MFPSTLGPFWLAHYPAGVKVDAICTFGSCDISRFAEKDEAQDVRRQTAFIPTRLHHPGSKMRKAVLSLVFTLAACMLAESAVAEIPWQTNLRSAHAQAEKSGKLLLLHFYTDNCSWCDRLEAGSFKSPDVIQTIGMSFVPVKVHAETNPRLAEMFKVSKFPTDVVVTTDGKTLVHKVSPQRPQEYVGMLAGTLGALSGPGPATQAIASNAPPAQPEAGTGSRGIPAHTAEARVSKNTKANLVGYEDDSMSLSSPSNSSDMPTGEEPELAMEGFCAVTVIGEDRWVEGKPEHGVIHLGKLYMFESAEKMKKFLADPIPFTPMLNEIDVVRFFEERKIVPGKREWGLKDPIHQRMFFFADEEAMNHFYNEYERYTDAAIEVMSRAIQDSNPGT